MNNRKKTPLAPSRHNEMKAEEEYSASRRREVCKVLRR